MTSCEVEELLLLVGGVRLPEPALGVPLICYYYGGYMRVVGALGSGFVPRLPCTVRGSPSS